MPSETPTPDEEPAVEEPTSGGGASEGDDEPVSEAQAVEADGEDAEGSPGSRPGVWKVLSGVLVLALIASLIALALLLRERSDLKDEAALAQEHARLAAAEEAAEEAAVNAMVKMTTYDYQTVDEDYAWIDELGTATFEEIFRAGRDDAVRLIKAVKASATGTVINSAADAVSEDEVEVLLFTDQELRQKGTKDPKLEETRVAMTLVLENGRWLVDDVKIENFVAKDSLTP